MLKQLFIASIPLLLLYLWEEVDIMDPPEIPEAQQWVAGNNKDVEDINVFKIDVPEERIADLQRRVAEWRAPAALKDTVHLKFMKDLASVMETFDWKQHERYLNTFKQYSTQVEGLDIHFIRSNIPVKNNEIVVPLVLIHGFPGSFWDFFKMIPILSNPSRFGFDFGVSRPIIFDVIVPSLPGFIFSQKPKNANMNLADQTRILKKLLERLHVEEYYIHGTEGLGTDIATLLAAYDEKKVKGLHLANPFVNPLYSNKVALRYLLNQWYDSKSTSLYDYFTEKEFRMDEDAQQIAIYTSSSPMALAEYLMSKWKYLTSPRDPNEMSHFFTLDELATVTYLYWLTDTLPYAAKIMENSYGPESQVLRPQVRAPTRISMSPDAPWRSGHAILARQYLNITEITELEKGGVMNHMQNPNEATADIFRFVELTLM